MQDKRGEFIGLRVTKDIKKRIENYASDRDFSVGELLVLAVLKYMGDIEEVNKILERKIIDKS